MNCRERSASATEAIVPPCSALGAGPDMTAAGGCRTNIAAGINSTHARMPIANIAVRQSYVVINQRASGEIVIGATPSPADTSDTARLRCVSNQPVVAAIIGAKKLPAATPMIAP